MFYSEISYIVVLHDYLLACEIFTVRTIALMTLDNTQESEKTTTVGCMITKSALLYLPLLDGQFGVTHLSVFNCRFERYICKYFIENC